MEQVIAADCYGLHRRLPLIATDRRVDWFWEWSSPGAWQFEPFERLAVRTAWCRVELSRDTQAQAAAVPAPCTALHVYQGRRCAHNNARRATKSGQAKHGVQIVLDRLA